MLLSCFLWSGPWSGGTAFHLLSHCNTLKQYTDSSLCHTSYNYSQPGCFCEVAHNGNSRFTESIMLQWFHGT